MYFFGYGVCNKFHKKLFREREMNLNFCMNLLKQENNENEPLFTSGSALMGLKFWREGYFPDARGGLAVLGYEPLFKTHRR